MTVEEIPDGEDDPNHPLNVAIAEFKARSVNAKRNARAMRRATQGWPVVRTDTDWEGVVVEADEDYASGAFLLNLLGGEAALDPLQTATILNLRTAIMEEMGIKSIVETMLLDHALFGYANCLRVQTWIGDLAYAVEYDAFGLESPTLHYHYGKRLADGLTAAEHTKRLRDVLLPNLDRANRMFLRNLQAIHELRRGSATTIAVAQLNVGASQLNISKEVRTNRKSRAPN